LQIPDLVARLSGLHATLSARLALHESLLSLNGRLDMVLGQIEMRSSAAPAPLAPRKGKTKAVALEKNTKRYVEGESSSSDDNGDVVDVEVDSGDSDDGSIEDVELGGESSDNETSDDEDEDSDESSEGRMMNGFIDDEAEEYSTDDESEDE